MKYYGPSTHQLQLFDRIFMSAWLTQLQSI